MMSFEEINKTFAIAAKKIAEQQSFEQVAKSFDFAAKTFNSLKKSIKNKHEAGS